MKKFITLIVIAFLPAFAFAQNESKNEAKVFPNPARSEGAVNLALDSNRIAKTIVIFSVNGEQPPVYWENPGTTFFLPKLSKGMYVFKIFIEGRKESISEKLLIQ